MLPLLIITYFSAFFRSDPIYAVVDKTKKRNSRLIAEVENTTLDSNDNNNKPNLQVYEAARCYSEPKNSKTHPSSASQEGAVLVLLPACLEESGTNSSARSLAGSGSEQPSSASSCTTSSSVSPASASDNNKNERARFSTDQRISSLQTVASAPIVQGQFSQDQDANNVKNSQKQKSKDQVIPNNNSVNVPRNSKEAVTVATSSVMFVNSPPKSCKYIFLVTYLLTRDFLFLYLLTYFESRSYLCSIAELFYKTTSA